MVFAISWWVSVVLVYNSLMVAVMGCMRIRLTGYILPAPQPPARLRQSRQDSPTASATLHRNKWVMSRIYSLIQHKTQRNAHHKTGHRIGASSAAASSILMARRMPYCFIRADTLMEMLLTMFRMVIPAITMRKRIDHQMKRPVGALYHPISFDSVGKNNLLV